MQISFVMLIFLLFSDQISGGGGGANCASPLFHVNIRNLTKHFDGLQTLINSVKIPFDILGITESKQVVCTKFPVNVNIDGYQIYSQPTKSTHGGVVMYVNKKLDHVVREDISVLEDEFETLWIEIKTGALAKNILCCCVYRHPNTDTKKLLKIWMMFCLS